MLGWWLVFKRKDGAVTGRDTRGFWAAAAGPCLGQKYRCVSALWWCREPYTTLCAHFTNKALVKTGIQATAFDVSVGKDLFKNEVEKKKNEVVFWSYYIHGRFSKGRLSIVFQNFIQQFPLKEQNEKNIQGSIYNNSHSSFIYKYENSDANEVPGIGICLTAKGT